MSELSLGLLTIATNGYTKYLPDLLQSASSHLKVFPNYCHYIFTDDVPFVQELANQFPNFDLKIIRVPNLMWPDATLLRYELYCQYKEIFSHDILMHLDADMYFLADLEFEVPPKRWEGGMAFVEHPGYFRPKLFDFRVTSIKARIRSRLMGGYGSWETSKMSTAYTPREQRRKYLCGGAWFGFRNEFLDFCDKARKNIEIDTQNGVVALWHDESHLNSIVSLSDNPTCFSSRYCYEPKYGKTLSNPILLAIDKSNSLKEQLRFVGYHTQ
jgi:histo-blood group ABO system transferase